MATNSTDIGPVPKDVTAALNLEDGTTYSIQNLETNYIKWAEQAAAPSADSSDYQILPPFATYGKALRYTPEDGEHLFMWTDVGPTRISSNKAQ